MRNIGLCILLSVVVLSIYACSTSNQGNLPNPAENNREAFSVEVVDGMGNYSPEFVVEETSNGVAVTVEVTGAEELAAANFKLHYDSKRFSPDRVEITDLFGINEQVLSLSILDSMNHVAVGVAQIRNRGGIPVSGNGDLATVFFNNGPAPMMRQASGVSQEDANSVSDLIITGQTADSISLRWTERNIGDYDNNSEVNVADISQIAILFGENNSTPHGKLVDGDGNGEINLADIAEIAKNYMNSISGYFVYTDGAGTALVGSGVTCDRDDFYNPANSKIPVVYTFTAPYDPIFPAVFTVRGVDQAVASTPGVKSNLAQPIDEEGAPNVPTDITAVGGETVGHSNVMLTWTKSTFTHQYDVAGYEIRRSDTGLSDWASIGEVGGESDSFADSGLVEGTYDYQVRARDFTDLTSDWSDIASATPWFQPAPDPPINLTAVPHATQSLAVDLNWDPPADGSIDIMRYKIFGREEGEAEFEQIGMTQFASTPYYTHSGLTQQVTYEYCVVTVDTMGIDSALSEMASSMCSEEANISITSLTTDKKTHFANGGDADAANLTVVSDPVADSVTWDCSVGDVTGSGTSVSWKPPAGTAPGVVIITCTVTKGAGTDQGTIDMFLTAENIKTALGVGGGYVDFTDLPSNVVPNAPYRPFNYYMDGETAVLLNLWGIW